jgi:hypothetical protein
MRRNRLYEYVHNFEHLDRSDGAKKEPNQLSPVVLYTLMLFSTLKNATLTINVTSLFNFKVIESKFQG